MAHALQQLLMREDSLFSRALEKLERIVDNDGVDTRLIADITHKAHDITRSLRLDPANSTGAEIYAALRGHIGADDRIEALLATDYVLFSYDGDIVSFNLIDLLEDVHSKRSFDDRSLEHAQRALMGEIIHRYTSHARTHDPTVRGLLQEVELLTENPVKNTKLPPLTKVQKRK